LLHLIRPAVNKTLFDRENCRLKTAASRLSYTRDLDVARQTLATVPLPRGRERTTVAAALARIHQNGESRSGIITATNRIKLALEQTRQDLHRMRISGYEWNAKMIEGLRKLQEEIGADHDLIVLKRTLNKFPDSLSDADTI
jgi:CHAD domain-containing protein